MVAVQAQTPLPDASEFILKQGGQLVHKGRPFYFAGANAYQLFDDAVWDDKKHLPSILLGRAEELGIRVIRTWAFNYNTPTVLKGASGPELVYPEDEMQALDSVIAEAAAHGIRLILAVGNLWPAYKGPEAFTTGAGLQGPDVDVVDFYASPGARYLYREHIKALTSRVNVLTGLRYRDDPTIMGWDVCNEPRCPGCTQPAEKQAHFTWLLEMSDALKVAAPKQLVMLGTEGFFGLDDAENKPLNPGAGSACEGEDWVKEGMLPAVDVLTMHLYWRQTEGVPDEDWRLMGWHSYMAFFKVYLEAHARIAVMLKKPLLLQEFNILLGRFSELERDALFAMAFDEVKVAQRTRGPLVGAMFWNAALRGVHPDTGYNIYFDDDAPPVRGSTAMRLPPDEDPVIAIAYANTTAIVSRSSIISTPAEGTLARLTDKDVFFDQPLGDEDTDGSDAAPEMAKPQPPDVQASSAQQGLAPASGSPEQQQGDAAASSALKGLETLPQNVGTVLTEAADANNRRRLLQQGKPAGADAFRRAQQRASCAEKEAAWWRPDPQRTNPGNVQALRWLAKVAGLPVLGIIAEAAAALNNYRYN